MTDLFRGRSEVRLIWRSVLLDRCNDAAWCPLAADHCAGGCYSLTLQVSLTVVWSSVRLHLIIVPEEVKL